MIDNMSNQEHFPTMKPEKKQGGEKDEENE